MEKTLNNEDFYIENISLTAEEVKNSKNKTFKILGLPKYMTFEDKETHEVRRILSFSILFNGAEVEYKPNKTSQNVLVKKYGRRLNDWIGKSGEFETLSQLVGKEKKEIIYVKNGN